MQEKLNLEELLYPEERALIVKLRASLSIEGKAGENTQNLLIPRAAVCVVLRHDDLQKGLCLLLVKKKERQGDPWSGHMAFPGGRFSVKDSNIFDTAAREVMEETGIDVRRNCEVLGKLSEIMPSSLRSIVVTPFVVLAPKETTVRMNEEIEQYFWEPLSYFDNMDNVTSYNVMRFDSRALDVPSYKLPEGYVVWGLTFRIIEEMFLGLAKKKKDYV